MSNWPKRLLRDKHSKMQNAHADASNSAALEVGSNYTGNFQEFYKEADFTPQDIEVIKRRFNKFKTVNEDTMGLTEFKHIMHIFKAASPTDAEDFFRAFNRSKTGKLTLQEFILGTTAADPQTVHILNSHSGFQRCALIFGFYDANGNETLEFAEFQRFIADSSATVRPGSDEKVSVSPEVTRRLAVEKARELGCIEEEKGFLHFSCIRFKKFYDFILSERLRGTSRLLRLKTSLMGPAPDGAVARMQLIKKTETLNESSSKLRANARREPPSRVVHSPPPPQISNIPISVTSPEAVIPINSPMSPATSSPVLKIIASPTIKERNIDGRVSSFDQRKIDSILSIINGDELQKITDMFHYILSDDVFDQSEITDDKKKYIMNEIRNNSYFSNFNISEEQLNELYKFFLPPRNRETLFNEIERKVNLLSQPLAPTVPRSVQPNTSEIDESTRESSRNIATEILNRFFSDHVGGTTEAVREFFSSCNGPSPYLPDGTHEPTCSQDQRQTSSVFCCGNGASLRPFSIISDFDTFYDFFCVALSILRADVNRQRRQFAPPCRILGNLNGQLMEFCSALNLSKIGHQTSDFILPNSDSSVALVCLGQYFGSGGYGLEILTLLFSFVIKNGSAANFVLLQTPFDTKDGINSIFNLKNHLFERFSDRNVFSYGQRTLQEICEITESLIYEFFDILNPFVFFNDKKIILTGGNFIEISKTFEKNKKNFDFFSTNKSLQSASKSDKKSGCSAEDEDSASIFRSISEAARMPFSARTFFDADSLNSVASQLTDGNSYTWVLCNATVPDGFALSDNFRVCWITSAADSYNISQNFAAVAVLSHAPAILSSLDVEDGGFASPLEDFRSTYQEPSESQDFFNQKSLFSDDHQDIMNDDEKKKLNNRYVFHFVLFESGVSAETCFTNKISTSKIPFYVNRDVEKNNFSIGFLKQNKFYEDSKKLNSILFINQPTTEGKDLLFPFYLPSPRILPRWFSPNFAFLSELTFKKKKPVLTEEQINNKAEKKQKNNASSKNQFAILTQQASLLTQSVTSKNSGTPYKLQSSTNILRQKIKL